MKFKKALKAMKEGKTVSRRGWSQYTAKLETPGYASFGSLVDCRCIVWSGGSHTEVLTVNVDDYEAKDWYIVEEGCGDDVPAKEEA